MPVLRGEHDAHFYLFVEISITPYGSREGLSITRANTASYKTDPYIPRAPYSVGYKATYNSYYYRRVYPQFAL